MDQFLANPLPDLLVLQGIVDFNMLNYSHNEALVAIWSDTVQKNMSLQIKLLAFKDHTAQVIPLQRLDMQNLRLHQLLIQDKINHAGFL